MNRHERRKQKALNSGEVLEEVKKMKAMLKIMHQNKDRLPHQIQMPDGTIIDALDGETDKLLDEIEAIALHQRFQN